VREITLRSERRTQLIEITREVEAALEGAGGDAALVFVPHTTAGVTINENADPAVAPSHIRSALMSPQVIVPLTEGRLALGTWQGIFFCEFDGPRSRKVLVTPL